MCHNGLKYQIEVKLQQQDSHTDSKTIICLFFVSLAIFSTYSRRPRLNPGRNADSFLRLMMQQSRPLGFLAAPFHCTALSLSSIYGLTYSEGCSSYFLSDRSVAA